MTPAKYLSLIVNFNYIDSPFHPLLKKIADMMVAQEDVVVGLHELIDIKYQDQEECEAMKDKLNVIFLPSYQATRDVIAAIQENKVEKRIIAISESLSLTMNKFNYEYGKLATQVRDKQIY